MVISSTSWLPPSGAFHEIDGFKSNNSGLNVEMMLPTVQTSDYYTVPSLHELSESEKSDPGFCSRVPNFKIGRFNYGHLKFTGFTDIRFLNLDEIVKFDSNSITVYPNEANKPPLGQGLNKPAEVTLILQLPISQGSNCQNITTILKSFNEKQGACFVSFDPSNFEWKFNVDHFSRFGLDDISDEEEEEEEEEDVEMDGFQTRPVNSPLVANGYGSELSHSLPANLRLDPVKMQEIRMLMLSNLDEEEEADEIRVPFTQLPSNRKYNRNPNPSSDCTKAIHDSPTSILKGKGLAFSSPFNKSNQKSKELYTPSTSKSPQSLLEYNLNGLDLDPLMDTSPSSTILLTGQRKGLPAQLSKVVGFKLHEENSHKTPISNTSLSNCIVDAGLFMGRSFRVGWGPNGVLIHSGNPLRNPKNQGLSSIIHIERVALDKIARDQTGKINKQLVEHCFESPLEFHKSLEHEFQEIETSDQKSLRLYKVVTDITMLEFISHSYIEILEKQYTVTGLESHSRTSLVHNIAVWDLIRALFFVGEPASGTQTDRTSDDEMAIDAGTRVRTNEPDEEALPLARRASFSYWLQESVADRVHEQISCLSEENYLEQILLLLTGRQLDQAVDLAVSKGDVRLAILLSQAGGSILTRSDMAQQLDLWRINGLDFEFIEPDQLKIFELLGGNVHNAVRDLSLDWKRYLGLVMWYQLGPDTAVQNIVQTYQQLLSEGKVPDPVPVYIEENPFGTAATEDRFDILYYLMLLHANYGSEEDLDGLIKVMFSALASSDDPLDHHMIWHQRSVLEAIGAVRSSDLNILDMSFAYQLLGLGLVHWAVYLVLHMDYLKYMHEKIIKEILVRYVDVWSKDEKQEKFIEELGVPKEWMHEALAIYYEYYGEKSRAIEHYIGCASWQRAHMIFMTSAAHSLFLSSKHSEIWRITSTMEEYKSEIPNWDFGAGIYIGFYDLRTSMHEESTMTDSDPLEMKREGCKRFFDQLNESLIIWGTKLPLDARVVYAKMSEELNSLLMATPGEGSAPDVPMNCFGTMLSAPLPEDYHSYHLQEALSVFTYLLSNDS